MKVFIVSIVVLFLVACESNQNQINIATDYVTRSVVYQKPGAAISLRESQVNLAVSGAQYSIEVNIGSAYPDGELMLSVHASDGLHIVGGEKELAISLNREVITLPYVLIAEEDGRYYLYLNALVERNGQKQSRALAFIVQVGEEELVVKDVEGDDLEKSDGADELIITLPVKEEIIY